MLSRNIIRSSLRALSRNKPIPRSLPKFSSPPRSRQPAPFTPRRFYSPPPGYPQNPRRGPRIVYRYDPEEARRARPLITTGQVLKAAKSQTTKWIVIIAVGSGTIFYFANLETVPVSGRRRFNCYSDATVEAEGRRLYQLIMQENENAILPSWDPRVRQVQRVMSKLIPASGLGDVDWEVHVIESPECNAFVIPGGKVFVYTGILPVAKNDDGLATILGHEIAHNLARHAAEHMSSNIPLSMIRWFLIFFDYAGYSFGLGRILGAFIIDFGIMKPASRKQESEADYIGLMMMAKSCYNPNEAPKVWQRMQEAQKEEIPQWLSTHPSNANRITTMQEWLPKAEQARNDSECAANLRYSEEFQRAVGLNDGWGVLRLFR